MLQYYRKDICFQEVPNEISISFSIAGCPHNCKNCSWKNTIDKEEKKNLTNTIYSMFLNKYKGLASCVLFLGGEWEQEDLICKLKMAKEKGYKTCLYTGCNLSQISEQLKQNLDFIKVGPYIEEKGGLSNPNTNQKFIDLINNKILNKYFTHQEAF